MIKSKFLISTLLLIGLTASVFGAAHKSGENLTTFQKSFLAHYSSETDKLVQLAEAFSEDGMEWRPAEGVRSVREAILHAASANYFFAGMFGAETPEGVNPRQFEKTITTKAETVKVLKASIAHAKKAVRALDEASLNENIKLFGQEAPRMQAVMLAGGHCYEHLGQLIGYARSSGVVPPWSQ
ncbi:MAG: DinB family protein [Verrucomicrobia bacterium]|nr:DinB family protein [Verrucomicrobiota bacterium]MDA1068483.1 DinB family protein [Verrucomicrobiota bacterium]